MGEPKGSRAEAGRPGVLDPEVVRHIAALSRIRVEEKHIPDLAARFADIIRYFDKLNELDTTGVEPMTGAVEITGATREDEPAPSLAREQGLANAPDKAEGFFTVPKVLGDS
jgi:aspartyl-tRNA(Asn)/glutamyl-tRNA(Gln) amidotransferase subunit C